MPCLIITAVCAASGSLRVRRRLCLLQYLREDNDLCVRPGVRPTAFNQLVSLMHRSRAGAAIWLCQKRMHLADVAASARFRDQLQEATDTLSVETQL